MRLGVTRSGVEVVYKPGQSSDDFRQLFVTMSFHDQFDIFCMYQFLVVRAKRRFGKESEEYEWWWSRYSVVEEALAKKTRRQISKSLSLATSYHQMKIGKDLLDDFWRRF